MSSFLKRKNIIISGQRYGIEAMSAMALGLFSSLIVGLILKTAGEQTALWLGTNIVSTNLITLGTFAMQYMGAAIGVAVAFKLKAPPLVLFTSLVTGALGAVNGGPAGALLAAIVGAEFGKMISGETKVDIIITPAVTMMAGYLVAISVSPLIGGFMTFLGQVIIAATEAQPLITGTVVALIVGLALTGPISSAALAIMLGLSGLAAGASTAGCAAQMIGFAVMSFKDNGISGLIAQGIGTSKLQLPNVLKNPWVLLPPSLAGAIGGALSATVFKMENIAAGAGMGTSGFVGQFTTLQNMGFTWDVLLRILLLHFILPAVLTLIFAKFMRAKGLIKDGDLKLEL